MTDLVLALKELTLWDGESNIQTNAKMYYKLEDV